MNFRMEAGDSVKGVSVNFSMLTSEPAGYFFAIDVSEHGQRVVARSRDINELVRMIDESGCPDAIITTSGKGVADTIFLS